MAVAPSVEGPFKKGLPVYAVLDTSGSMGRFEELLNETLESIYEVIDTTPQVREFIHLSVVSFNTQPHVVTNMTEFDDVTILPTVSCAGTTNFAPLFRKLRDCIESDVPALSARGIKVLRPVVFLLTDGIPTDSDEQWTRSLDALLDPSWRPRPNIISYGFGEAQAEVLGRVSTVAAYIAEPGQDNAGALSEALTSLLNSMVASAKAQELQVAEEVKGFRSVPLDYVDL